MAGELTSLWLANGRGVVDTGLTPGGGGTVTLVALSVSPNTATVGQAYSGSVTGKTSGSALTLSGAGAAGLSIVGNAISGTPTASGPVDIIETLAGATNSPRTSSGVITVTAAAVSGTPMGLLLTITR